MAGLKWTQKEITKWAVSTFGAPEDIGIILNRAGAEFDEAVLAYYEGASGEVVVEELADTYIIMCQFAEHLGFDLLEFVQDKMQVNLVRAWSIKGDGTAQHV